MRALEQQQAQELLSIPYNPTSLAHLAVSAPTTPPRVNAVLNDDNLVRSALSHSSVDVETLKKAVGSAVADNHGLNGHYARPAGAKGMPASRRTSGSSHDEELAGHLQGLYFVGGRQYRATPSPGAVVHSLLPRGRYGYEERTEG
ncbi:hypothetical protein DEU56DRAFT_918167 [Suillus clintonianus]|uniref:uncharacterized protein n=1 Tax=Suillus clintonianus TaxID=1904413 RepID=UPI001B87B718|nr:uncharacterized protein DEU56DRAFT_918167 [Suillus clintonianus]KAG2121481.1 hypothetical protein DEU56DRAFT_918167 [Suillus clintonianus]